MDRIQAWKELDRKTIFEKYGRGLDKVGFRLPNDKREDYYVQTSGPIAIVLALAEDNQVILVKQFVPGLKKTIIDLPGGYISSEKGIIEEAGRELLEETGYMGKTQFVTGVYFSFYSNLVRYLVIATDCVKAKEPEPDKNEFVQTVLMSLGDFRKHLRTGRLTCSGLAYIGLDYLNLL